MLFKQFVDDALGCASYLVGDEHSRVAVVVDPAYAIEQYLDECERHGLRLVCALETHTHADHVSGHGRLALEHDDDDPLTEEDWARIRESEAAIAAGRVTPWEEVKRELDL